MSVQSISKYSVLEQAYPDMLKGVGTLIQKGKMSKRFSSIKLTEEEFKLLEMAKELCEIKIIEMWNDNDNSEFKSVCVTYFDIASQIPIKTKDEQGIYEWLKLIAFGYLGEHWHFVLQLLKDKRGEINALEVKEGWSIRLLTLCLKALVYLVVKDNSKDIKEAKRLIDRLRDEQEKFEKGYLATFSEDNHPYVAAELVSLYYFAKSIEVLGNYLLEGKPSFNSEIKRNLDVSRRFASLSDNILLELFLQFFESFAKKMIHNTIWHNTTGFNSLISDFNRFISGREQRGVYELLYPQQRSFGQLLNPVNRAIVLSLPTSSGKTMIAEYRILQALNNYQKVGGWVAYVVPTKTLVNQTFIQLTRDFGGIGLKVEKASGAIELDGFEQHLVENGGLKADFDILVTTYEKMNLLVRQKLGTTEERPLVLTVVDEAHNIEQEQRGLNLELLLATIKNDCKEVSFLLMTPDIKNASAISEWLAEDRGHVISLDLDWWQPNERVVGAIQVEGKGGRNRDFNVLLKALHTDKGTYHIGEDIHLVAIEDAAEPISKIVGAKKKIATLTASRMLDIEKPMLVIVGRVADTFSVAEELYNASDVSFEEDEDVNLLIKFVRNELGDDFPLARFLQKRIGIHCSALPDEIRYLIEDLMCSRKLQALVATTTVAQGINFPVSKVIMGAYNYPYTGDMPVRDFWNIAGRVGRVGQDNIGWIGLAAKNEEDIKKITKYVHKASEDLQSQLSDALEKAKELEDANFNTLLHRDDRWSQILQYISHLSREFRDRESFLAHLDIKLQGTLGYNQLTQENKNFLREKLRDYAKDLKDEDASQADETGFSTVSIRNMAGKLRECKLTPSDWTKKQLFSKENENMRKLVGIMMNTHEIRKSMQSLNLKKSSIDGSIISELLIDWVNGSNIPDIAAKVYPEESENAIAKTAKALYSTIINSVSWSMAALQRIPTSGVKWDKLSEVEKKQMANLPAYVYYGVNTDEGVLMRKNNVPRSIANNIGKQFSKEVDGEIFNQPSSSVYEWLKNQTPDTWSKARSSKSLLSGEDYHKVWKKLNGISE
ncbi:MAG: DEAD/DEAH box helicase [Candidatus Cloacimonas sp.]|nr:DEAD/DEAH box helicase [Candidatus Cloacimonadota bacterium]